MIPLDASPIHRLLADNLRRIRKAKGLSQEELADRARVDRTHVGNIENCRNSPGLDVISRLAEALDTEVRDLFSTDYEVPENRTPLDRINAVFPYVRRYQRLAQEFGIDDIFQDNGGKLLQTLVITGLKNLVGREGNDAVDDFGQEYELKTVNIQLQNSFSTHHHLTPTIVAKYRQVTWLFCVYNGIEIIEMYEVTPQALEPQFDKWLKVLRDDPRRTHLNNPKIPLKFIRLVGTRIYKDAADGFIAPGPVLAHRPKPDTGAEKPEQEGF